MDILMFLLVGLVAGWLGGILVDGHGFGVVGDILVGIVGAFIGGMISTRFMGLPYGFWSGVGSATLGAVILLFVAKIFRRGSHNSVL